MFTRKQKWSNFYRSCLEKPTIPTSRTACPYIGECDVARLFSPPVVDIMLNFGSGWRRRSLQRTACVDGRGMLTARPSEIMWKVQFPYEWVPISDNKMETCFARPCVTHRVRTDKSLQPLTTCCKKHVTFAVKQSDTEITFADIICWHFLQSNITVES